MRNYAKVAGMLSLALMLVLAFSVSAFAAYPDFTTNIADVQDDVTAAFTANASAVVTFGLALIGLFAVPAIIWGLVRRGAHQS